MREWIRKLWINGITSCRKIWLYLFYDNSIRGRKIAGRSTISGRNEFKILCMVLKRLIRGLYFDIKKYVRKVSVRKYKEVGL